MMKAAALLALVLGACVARAFSADCGADCADCARRLRLRSTQLNPAACVLQCEGHLNTGGSWGLCRDVLQTTESAPEEEQVSTESTTGRQEQHQEEKKYGGFMKRYGGFMKRYGGFMKRYGGFMKKATDLYAPEPDDVDRGREILSYNDVARLADQVEHDGEREEARMRDVNTAKGGAAGLEGMAKRYGGFMRRGYDSEGGVRPLIKRYGGFMRRVGRPDWGEEIKRYGGFLKRFPQDDEEEDESTEVEKRYGGFMDY